MTGAVGIDGGVTPSTGALPDGTFDSSSPPPELSVLDAGGEGAARPAPKLAPLFSSAHSEWSTPQWLFDKLDRTFRFEIDLAANEENRKCEIWLGPGLSEAYSDALSVAWHQLPFKVGWLNPPYGRGIGEWVDKAGREALLGFTTVCLLPVRTDTKWWNEHVKDKALVVFLKGRLKFGDASNAAPFPSAVAIYLPPLEEK